MNIVSEGNAIIEMLENECKFYEQAILNESYSDENQRIVFEAKFEMIQEAVGAAIVAAIIAVIGAIIALIAKLCSLMKKGQDKVVEKFEEFQKEEEKAEKEYNDYLEKIKKEYNDRSEKMKKDFEDEKKENEKYERIVKEYLNEKELTEQEQEMAVKKAIETAINVSSDKDNSGGVKGLSLIDFSSYIKKDAIKELIDLLKEIDDKKLYYVGKDEFDRVMHMLESENEINKLLFDGYYAKVKDNESIRDVFFRLYNENLVSLSQLSKGWMVKYMTKKVKELNNSANKVQSYMNSDLKVLEKRFKDFKSDYIDSMATSHIRDSVKQDNMDFEDNNSVKFYGKTENGSTNTEKFKNYILRVEKLGLDKINQFINTWTVIENVRMRIMAFLPQSLSTAKKNKEKTVYEKYEKQYGEEFTKRIVIRRF